MEIKHQKNQGNNMIISRVKLRDSKSKSYFLEDLEWPSLISSMIEKQTLKEGQLFTYLPQHLKRTSVNFEQGYALDLGSNENLVFKFFRKFLSSDENNLIIVEQPNSEPCDPYLAHYRGKWMRHKTTVFDMIFSDSDVENKFDFGKFYKAFLSKLPKNFKYDRGSEISKEELIYIGKHCKYITISIFDDEGFMIWAAPGSDVGII